MEVLSLKTFKFGELLQSEEDCEPEHPQYDVIFQAGYMAIS